MTATALQNSPEAQQSDPPLRVTLSAGLDGTRARVGRWLSAALDDPNVCAEMKDDVRAWFDAGGHVDPPQVFGIIDPDYARVFTQARIVAWQYGFACLAHGSFTRDLDLLLVPWAAAARADDVDWFAPRIAEAAGLKVSPNPPSIRPHGRRTWTLVFPGFADRRWVDLSVFVPSNAELSDGRRPSDPTPG